LTHDAVGDDLVQGAVGIVGQILRHAVGEGFARRLAGGVIDDAVVRIGLVGNSVEMDDVLVAGVPARGLDHRRAVHPGRACRLVVGAIYDGVVGIGLAGDPGVVNALNCSVGIPRSGGGDTIGRHGLRRLQRLHLRYFPSLSTAADCSEDFRSFRSNAGCNLIDL
jgi:hypothetical protein